MPFSVIVWTFQSSLQPGISQWPSLQVWPCLVLSKISQSLLCAPDAVAKLIYSAAFIQGRHNRDSLRKCAKVLSIPLSEGYHLLGNTPSRLYGCDHWVGTIAEEDRPVCADVGTVNAKTEVGRTWAWCRGGRQADDLPCTTPWESKEEGSVTGATPNNSLDPIIKLQNGLPPSCTFSNSTQAPPSLLLISHQMICIFPAI